MSTTDRGRRLFSWLFAVVVLAAVGGWLFGRDPTQLGVVLMWVAAAIGLGEASNVGKRATYNSEAARE